MVMTHNPFVMQGEVFFINYEEIIKSPYPFILDKIKTDMLELYKDVIHIDKISELTMKSLLTLCYYRDTKNVLEYLAKDEFDFVKTLNVLMSNYPELYDLSEPLAMHNTVKLFLGEKFTKHIYIHSDAYDERIAYDIKKTFKNADLVTYVYGPMGKVLENLPMRPTSYFLNDIEHIHDIVKAKDLIEYSNIFIADYPHNFEFNEELQTNDFRFDVGEVIGESICKVAQFVPFEITDEHIENFDKITF